MNNQIVNLNISALKVHPQNQEFFDDITGVEYETFKKSIQEDGIVTPITISPDMTIISGHQRVRACKDLNIDLVPVIIDESLIDEDYKLKRLIIANFSRLKNDEVKQRKIAVKYVELCGMKHGGSRTASSDNHNLTLEEIAKELGISKPTLTELLSIERNLIPEIKDLIDEGKITKTTASKVLSKLTKQEQEQLISDFGKDYISNLTQKKAEEIIKERKLDFDLETQTSITSKVKEIKKIKNNLANVLEKAPQRL